jgi:hypothetical protein
VNLGCNIQANQLLASSYLDEFIDHVVVSIINAFIAMRDPHTNIWDFPQG